MMKLGHYFIYRGEKFKRVDMITNEEKFDVLKNCIRNSHYCKCCPYQEYNDCMAHLHLDIEIYINWLNKRIEILERLGREQENFEEVSEVPLGKPVKFVCRE